MEIPRLSYPEGEGSMHAASGPRPTVLVVEDEAHIRELVCLHLDLEKVAAEQAADGNRGLELAKSKKFDLVILDLMLPGLDGVTVCRAIRRDSPNADTPILMLTARREESDKVVGLDSGADDYLTKPFGVRELMARVRALLRRAAARAAVQAGAGANGLRSITYKHIAIDPSRRAVTAGNRTVQLTTNEFQLLYVLLSNPGIVFSREALLRKVWKDDTFVTVRSVDTLVKRVRKKVEEDPADPAVILTVWGAGYKAADV
jgi:DNA-binding response OmpR family regulator